MGVSGKFAFRGSGALNAGTDGKVQASVGMTTATVPLACDRPTPISSGSILNFHIV